MGRDSSVGIVTRYGLDGLEIEFRWRRDFPHPPTRIQCRGWRKSRSIPVRLKSGNACYHSVQNLLSSSLLSKSVKIKICRTIILPVVLCGCETWSLALREECRLRVFESRVLRRIFGPKRDEVTGELSRLHDKELHSVYSSPNIESRRLSWVGHVARMGETRGAYRSLVWNPEGKRPPGRHMLKWEDNIKTDLRRVGWGHVLDWFGSG